MQKKGFTLIELLLVIAIIGILASVALISLNGARETARTESARSQLRELQNAIRLLEGETGESPGPTAEAPCEQNAEIFLDGDCNNGLVCGKFSFPNWDGPYLSGEAPTDPWGNYYIYDPDYECSPGVIGCEGVPPSYESRVVHSGGPNGSGFNQYGADNIVLILDVCGPE